MDVLVSNTHAPVITLTFLGGNKLKIHVLQHPQWKKNEDGSGFASSLAPAGSEVAAAVGLSPGLVALPERLSQGMLGACSIFSVQTRKSQIPNALSWLFPLQTAPL